MKKTPTTDSELDQTKRLMGALLRMPPKPHEDMKVHKDKRPKAKRPAKRNAGKSRS